MKEPINNSKEKHHWYEKWQIITGIILSIVTIISIAFELPAKIFESFDIRNEQYNELSLKVYIHGSKDVSEILDYGPVRIRLGQYRLPIENVDSRGEVEYEGIPLEYGDDSIQLELLSRPYKVVNQSAYLINESKRITFTVEPKSVLFYGTIYDNEGRVSGAILEIDSGLARDTTDIHGNFKFIIPEKGEGDSGKLSILYNGKERFNRECLNRKGSTFQQFMDFVLDS